MKSWARHFRLNSVIFLLYWERVGSTTGHWATLPELAHQLSSTFINLQLCWENIFTGQSQILWVVAEAVGVKRTKICMKKSG